MSCRTLKKEHFLKVSLNQLLEATGAIRVRRQGMPILRVGPLV